MEPVKHEIVLKDVDCALSEEDAVRMLQDQGVRAISAFRFHRTARGKPAKVLPLMRIVVSDEAQRDALLAAGATLAGKHCSAGPVHMNADSASARGWTPDGPQHRPNRQPAKPVPPPPPASAAEAVAPLQGVPYPVQLAQKRASVLEAFELLSTGSCSVDDVLPSPRTEGYRNKCEFSIGTDASGRPSIGFVVGRQSGAHTVESPAGCNLVSLEMRAAVARVEAAVRRSSLPAYDRAGLCGFWLQLACRQAFHAGSPPQLMLVLTVKIGEHPKAVVDEAVAAVGRALQEAPLEPPAQLSLWLQVRGQILAPLLPSLCPSLPLCAPADRGSPSGGSATRARSPRRRRAATSSCGARASSRRGCVGCASASRPRASSR